MFRVQLDKGILDQVVEESEPIADLPHELMFARPPERGKRLRRHRPARLS